MSPASASTSRRAISQVEMTKVYSAVSYANDNTVPSVRVRDGATGELANVRVKLRKILALKDGAAAAAAETGALQAAVKAFRTAIASYEALISDDKDRSLLDADRAAFEVYDTLVQNSLVLAGQNR